MSADCKEEKNEIRAEDKKNSEGLFFLDVLRAIACLCVVMIHTSAGFVVKDFGSLNFWVGNIFNSPARIGVPLFVMISGTVFLDEKYDYTNKKLIRHIKKIVIFFLFWSICYSIFYNVVIPLIKHTDISLRKTVAEMILGHYHLWFCFLIVGLYLIIPLLRLWVKKENVKKVRYFIILSLLFSMFLPSIIKYLSLLFPSLDSLNLILDYLNLRYVGGFTAYFVLGWYLNNFEVKHKKIIVFSGLIGVAISIFGTALLSILTNEANQAYDNLSVHVALQTIAVYVLVKNKSYGKKTPGRFLKKSVNVIAKNSLGIYAVHIVILWGVNIILAGTGITSAALCIPIGFIATLALSTAISFIIGKIPVLKNIV